MFFCNFAAPVCKPHGCWVSCFSGLGGSNTPLFTALWCKSLIHIEILYFVIHIWLIIVQKTGGDLVKKKLFSKFREPHSKLRLKRLNYFCNRWIPVFMRPVARFAVKLQRLKKGSVLQCATFLRLQFPCKLLRYCSSTEKLLRYCSNAPRCHRSADPSRWTRSPGKG